jgi:hypothetical protein
VNTEAVRKVATLRAALAVLDQAIRDEIRQGHR